MNTDIRLSVTFPNHPKIIKLQRRLESQAVVSLIYLWIHVAQNKSSGVLANMSAEDIEIAAQWNGQPDAFVKTLVELRLLDHENNTYTVHNWEKNNPYAFHASDRSAKAIKAAQARWGNKQNDNPQCSEHKQAMQEEDTSNAPSPDPSPSPAPLPDISLSDDKNGAIRLPPCPHQEIISLYHEILPMCPRVKEWNQARRRFLQGRWRENSKRQKLDWWSGYFSYVSKSDFLTGKVNSNNGQRPFLADLEWLIRPGNLVKVIEGKYENKGSV